MKAGFFNPSDGYGLYMLIIDRGMEMRYGGGVGSVWGGVDLIVEVVRGEDPEIARRRGF
jgi:hypothetical protein